MKFIVEVKVDPRWARAFKSVQGKDARRKHITVGIGKGGKLRSLATMSANGVSLGRKYSDSSLRGKVTVDNSDGARTYVGKHTVSSTAHADVSSSKTMAALRKHNLLKHRGYVLGRSIRSSYNSVPTGPHTTSPSTNPNKRRPIIMYHGTTDKHHHKIAKFGLRPASDTKSVGWGPANPDSNYKPGHVYLSRSADGAVEAAHAATEHHGGKPIVYRVTVHNHEKLDTDEDYSDSPHHVKNQGGKNHWFHSMRQLGSVAHKGRIPAKHLAIHRHDPGYGLSGFKKGPLRRHKQQ